MKFTRGRRIALELFGPPLMGAILLDLALGIAAMWATLIDGQKFDWSGQMLAAMVLFAYVFAGLPSIAYTTMMEWMFRRGLDPASRRTVWWSTILGLLSGAGIVAVIDSGRGAMMAYAMFIGLGGAVGLALGLLIKSLSAHACLSTPDNRRP